MAYFNMLWKEQTVQLGAKLGRVLHDINKGRCDDEAEADSAWHCHNLAAEGAARNFWGSPGFFRHDAGL